MDEDIEQMMVSVRADTRGFARDVAAMRAGLEGPMEAGAERAGRAIDAALARTIRTGKFGFEDLARVANSALSGIAVEAVKGGLSSVIRGGSLASTILGLFGGAPGRATGGPVSPGRPYMVGERGPELFVPTSAGRVEAAAAGVAAREVRVAITVNARGGEAAGALQQSGRQVARAVKAALAQVE